MLKEAEAVAQAGSAGDRIASVEAFQVTWRPGDPPGRRTAFVRVRTEGGLVGHGEASPMMGGEHSLLVVRDFAGTGVPVHRGTPAGLVGDTRTT